MGDQRKKTQPVTVHVVQNVAGVLCWLVTTDYSIMAVIFWVSHWAGRKCLQTSPCHSALTA